MNIPGNQNPVLPLNAARHVSNRWTPKLVASGWTPIADAFLSHYGDLGITSAEAMFVIHLISFKWDAKKPYPSFSTLATKMNMTHNAVRKHARALEQRNLLTRIPRPGHSNSFDLTPLFQALEDKLLDSANANQKKRSRTNKDRGADE